jgi:hypothetical protein
MKNTTFLYRIMWLLLLLLNMTASNAQTFNLHTIEPATVPSGATLEWYNATPFTAATMVSNVSAVGVGLYYAVYNYGSGCLSNGAPFKLVKTTCPTNTADLYASVDSTQKPAGSVVTFHTAKLASNANVYTGNPRLAPTGTYYVAYHDVVNGCYTYSAAIRVMPDLVCAAHPDMNATMVNVAVAGNVSTNDYLPGSPAYGVPVRCM